MPQTQDGAPAPGARHDDDRHDDDGASLFTVWKNPRPRPCSVPCFTGNLTPPFSRVPKTPPAAGNVTGRGPFFLRPKTPDVGPFFSRRKTRHEGTIATSPNPADNPAAALYRQVWMRTGRTRPFSASPERSCAEYFALVEPLPMSGLVRFRRGLVLRGYALPLDRNPYGAVGCQECICSLPGLLFVVPGAGRHRVARLSVVARPAVVSAPRSSALQARRGSRMLRGLGPSLMRQQFSLLLLRFDLVLRGSYGSVATDPQDRSARGATDPTDRSLRGAKRSLRGALMPCYCREGWICEQHPARPWPHEVCAGPGMLCQDPACVVGRVLRAELDARREPPKT